MLIRPRRLTKFWQERGLVGLVVRWGGPWSDPLETTRRDHGGGARSASMLPRREGRSGEASPRLRRWAGSPSLNVPMDQLMRL